MGNQTHKSKAVSSDMIFSAYSRVFFLSLVPYSHSLIMAVDHPGYSKQVRGFSCLFTNRFEFGHAYVINSVGH